ncbi:MAG: hypothetical protein AVDCRST_MAG13-3493, partial [uncultured Solirubrobacteraceae bacterium]
AHHAAAHAARRPRGGTGLGRNPPRRP